MLEKVQQDPTGLRIVQAAIQQCVIEDQQEQIKQLKAALTERAAPDEDGAGQ